MTEQKYNKELIITEIDNIDIHPLNDRIVDEEHVDELASILKEKGQDDSRPIWCVKEENKWLCIAGKHTYLAAKKSGLTHLIIVDKTAANPLDNALDVVRTNISLPNDMLAIARNYLYVAKEFGLNQREYANKIGKSESYVSNCIKALEFSETPGLEDIAFQLSPTKMAAISRAPEDKQLGIAKKAVENDWNIDQINDEVSKERKLRDYEDSNLESPQPQSEPTKEMCFIVPLSLVDTINDAIKKVKEESEEDGIPVSSGFSLGLVCGYYLGNMHDG